MTSTRLPGKKDKVTGQTKLEKGMDAAASTEKGLVDAERFAAVRKEILFQKREKRGIGTLKEKTLHAVLKEYLEPDKGCQEIRVDRYVADIKR